ncbi:Ferrous-iron efflux pump FieF [subsurface metagenome]
MNQEKVSIISTGVNLLMAVFKLVIGLFINSVALIADAIHSGLDVFSSFVTFLGIKAAKKPVDEKHPYGYYRAESLAGFVVALLLGLSAFWIFYEGGSRFFKLEPVKFSLWAIGLIVLSVIINEAMARLKFHYGRKHESLALVADAEHSRADVISSAGVLIGLILVRYFIYADAIVAILIGFYILKQTFRIGKEITDSLLDVANKDLEEKIKKIFSAHKIDISGIKTRKIGGTNFAEIKIQLDPRLKVDKVSELTATLENKLLNNISELKYVVISVESHEMKRGTIVSLGKKFEFKRGFEPIGPKKIGKRTIIPLENNEISDHFGVEKYLVVDQDEKGKILRKEKIKNPYFEVETGHGFKFTKAISADKVITRQIGANAKRNLEAYNIELEISAQDKKLEDIL